MAILFSNPYESFFRQNNAIMVLMDEKGRIVDANNAAISFYGYTLNQIMRVNIRDISLLPSSDLEAALEKAIQGELKYYKAQHRLATGEIRHVEVNTTDILIENNKFLFSIISDISDCEYISTSLLNSLQRFELLFNNCNDAIFVHELRADNTPGLFSDVNIKACTRLGYSRDELLKMSPEDIDADGMEAVKKQALQNIVETGQATLEMIHIGKYGKRIPVELSSRTFIDNGKRYILTVARDISERKELEKALKDSEYFFKESQRAASIGSYFVDFATGLWRSSAVLDSIFGIDKDYNKSIPGWLEIVYPDDRELVDTHLKEIVNGQHKVFGREYRIIRMSDKQVRWVYDLGEFNFDNNSNISSMIGTIQDITEHKNARELLRKQSIELAAANQGLEAFAYSVAHDLRNPLHTIISCSEILIDAIPADNKDAQEALGYIINSGKRMAQIITDLMLLSNITRHEIRCAKCSLSEIALSTTDECRRTDKNRKVDIIIEPELFADADEGLVKILMENLLQNAWKFTSKKENARIEFGKKDGDNKYPVYYVRDNGIGFDMSFEKKLFKPFHRLHSQKDYDGTGIGLTIVKRIVEKHGGTIKVEAEENIGATFYFSLDHLRM